MYFDDTVGMMIYGGSELSKSFKGYIGKVTFYRRRAIMPQEVSHLPDIKVILSIFLLIDDAHANMYFIYIASYA